MTERRRSSRLPAAIEALSLSLPGSRLSPETFRLAKFDRPEVSVTFWKLLYFLLKQIQDKETIEPADTEAQVRFVKRVVLSHGYRRREFYQLPSDGSEGSRELLLVFSWLMCRIGLVEQLLTLSRVKPWDETVICMCDAPLKSLKDGKNPVATTQWKDQKDVRYLQWLNGRLQFRWRNCHTEQQEHCKLLHKVHACTVGSQTNPTIGHFSVLEADVMRQPDNYKELLELMESENSQLKAFLRWKPLESVYWSWMETVLDPKMESVKPHTVCKKESILASADLGCYGFGKMVEEIDRCRKDLVTLRSGLRELAKCRKLGCCEKVRARKQEQLEERELSRTIRKIQEVVELKLSDLKYHSSAMRINQMHGPHRLVFKAKCLKGSNMDHGRSAPNKNIPEGISAADVICDLKKKEARLKVELKQRQDVSRRKVQEAAEGLGQVLFIPPTKRPIIEFGKVQSL